ncbi:MAG: gamma carbonic anhydrase family protein, partial [Alphaproteobacteria bacterium]
MAVYSLDDLKLETEGDDYWIAPNAAVIGNVRLRKNASIWFGVTIRGDMPNVIEVGENSNIQDNSVL